MRNFFFKRPDWFPSGLRSEGYWRLAQVFRIGPAALCLIIALIVFVVVLTMGYRDSDFSDQLGLAALWLIAAITSFVLAHFLIRLIVWIIEGFNGSGKASN